jgi:hypothetical protein
MNASRNDRESGFALASVMAASVILMLLASAVVAYGVGSQNISRHDQNWNGALSAAEAGIDDYVFRLNQNSNYWQYNAGNLPPDGNLAFKQYVSVAGGSTPAQYRYDVDAGTLKTDGVIKLTSTGKVNGTERTVYASLRRRSFIDYLYFTDYETKDPASYTGSPFTAAEAQVACSKYYYAGRDSNCTDINFVSGDTINGPLHSNDAYMVCGSPHFNDNTSTSWNDPSNKRYRVNSSCGGNSPVFANPGDPKLLPPLTMPPTNSAIKAETAVGAGGCLYTGPTRIVLNSSGSMTVHSPYSKDVHNTAGGQCPTNGTGKLPSNGVIYVQTVPSVSTDANYTSGCPSTPLSNGRSQPLGLPINSDKTTYNCRYGDVFIEGTLSGQLTVAAENNIDVTWNLTYKSGLGGSDLLGLVANNYVEVYHPVQCTSGNSYSCNLDANFPNESARNAKFQNPTIDAAILSVNHSFWVQNYAIGAPLGNLTVNGAIAQRYRGPVGTTSGGSPYTGFSKNYTYDQRLKYLSPPKFLDPVASAWGEATWAEIPVPAADK